MYFSICLQYRRPITDLPPYFSDILARLCDRRRVPGAFHFDQHCDVLYKASGLVTLVEAPSEGEAIALRRETHPHRFNENLVGMDVLPVESPEAWSDVVDSTFMYHPSYIVAVRAGAGTERSFEVPESVFRKAMYFW